MTHPATDTIIQLFTERNVEFRVVEHPPCRTSEESAKARAEQGHIVTGAKAIVVKMYWKGGVSDFNVVVLPGTSKIDPKALSARLDDLKDFRFATREELATYTDGLEPGMMPPFGGQVFERLKRLYVDSNLLEQVRVGFNVADLSRSIIVGAKDYASVVEATDVFPFAASPT